MEETRSCEVRFTREDHAALVHPGATIMDAALLCGVWIDAPCGGEGECGKCAVRTTGALAVASDAEREHLSTEERGKGTRLACQAVVEGDCAVDTLGVGAWSAAKSGLASHVPLAVDLPDLQSRSFAAPPLGAAIDVGTTTLCVSLLDLRSGRRLAITAAENPQTASGADVMTRIERCIRDDLAGVLRRQVLEAINSMLASAAAGAGRPVTSVERLVMVGNTTMLHLALGADPSPLGCYPFAPALTGPVLGPAEDYGIAAASGARLLAPRIISGFLGADLVAAVLAAGVRDSDELVMLVDLGTNGEIALGNREGIVACSTAAGPAFEGAEISAGMRAVPGAIEGYSRDGSLRPAVLGGGEPLGICGSGLLDAVAALLDAGLLEPSGRLVEPAAAEGIAPGRVRERDGMREFVLAGGTDIALTQADVRQLQLAKGAVGAGVEVLLAESAVGAGAVKRVYLAGVFGSYLKPASAVRLGIFPPEMRDAIEAVGNAALTGAEMMLCSERCWAEAAAVSESVRVVELSGSRMFRDAFLDNLTFPAAL